MSEVVIGGPGLGISDCIPITSFGFLDRLKSSKHHQKMYFCDFPIALIPATMPCSQATAKLREQKSASMGAHKCTQHVLSHKGSVENGKPHVKDPENAEKCSLGPTYTGQGVIVETPHAPES